MMSLTSLGLVLFLLVPPSQQDDRAEMERSLADTALALDVLKELQGRWEQDPDSVMGMLALVTEAPASGDTQRGERLFELHDEVGLRHVELGVLESTPEPADTVPRIELPDPEGPVRRPQVEIPEPARLAMEPRVEVERERSPEDLAPLAVESVEPTPAVSPERLSSEKLLLGIGGLLAANVAFVIWSLRSSRRGRNSIREEVESLTYAVRDLRRNTLYPHPASGRTAVAPPRPGPAESRQPPTPPSLEPIAPPSPLGTDRGDFRKRVEALVGVRGYSRLSLEERKQRLDTYVANSRFGVPAQAPTLGHGRRVEDPEAPDRLELLEQRIAQLSSALERAQRPQGGPRRERYETPQAPPSLEDDFNGGAKHGMLTQIFEENLKLQGFKP